VGDTPSQSLSDRRDPARQARRREGRRLSDIFDSKFQHVTVDQAARYLQVDIRTVWKWIDGGQLPAYRFPGRIVRIEAGELEAFRQRNRLAPRGL